MLLNTNKTTRDDEQRNKIEFDILKIFLKYLDHDRFLNTFIYSFPKHVLFACWVQKVKGRSYWRQSYDWNNLISDDSAKHDLISRPIVTVCATLPDLRSETQHLLKISADYVTPHCNGGVRRIFHIGQIHKESNCGYMFRQELELSPPRWNYNEAVQATQKLFYLYKGVEYLKKYHITGH